MEGSLQGDRALFQPMATETRDVPRLGVPKATIFPPGVQTLTVCPIALSSAFWGTAWTKTSHRWAEVDRALCCCPVGPFILSLGCCSLKAPKPWRKGQP